MNMTNEVNTVFKYKALKSKTGVPMLVKEKEYKFNDKLDDLLKVTDFLRNQLQMDKELEEYMYEICFDTKLQPIAIFEISHGDLSSTNASPREIYQKSLLCNAAFILIAHNHPSGDCNPSSCDDDITNKVKSAGELLGVPLIDHIVVGDTVYSYMEHGLLRG